MNLRELSNKEEFGYRNYINIVAGEGLGVSYSSLEQMGKPLWPYRPIGAAKIECNLNLVNRNLHVKDTPLHFEEANGILELGFSYNHNAANIKEAWRINIKKIKDSLSKDKTKLILIEEDGHETTYLPDPNEPNSFK